MTYRGTVRSGVIVLPAGVALPEGAEVVIVLPGDGPPGTAGGGIWARLADLGRWAESQPSDLPADLAENHDHYLRGHSRHP
jgi:hypothetical protein